MKQIVRCVVFTLARSPDEPRRCWENVWRYEIVGDCGLQTCQVTQKLKRATTLEQPTIPAIFYTACYPSRISLLVIVEVNYVSLFCLFQNFVNVATNITVFIVIFYSTCEMFYVWQFLFNCSPSYVPNIWSVCPMWML